MSLDVTVPGWVGGVIGTALRFFGRGGGDGLRFDPRIIAAEVARRAAAAGRPPPFQPGPGPDKVSPIRPPGAPVRGGGPGRPGPPVAPPFVGQPPPDYFAPGWEEFMACATRAGKASVRRGKSTDGEIADAIFRACGPRPPGTIPAEFDDYVIPKVPTADTGRRVFLPTIPEVLPVVVPAVREIIRRAIPVIVPMLPDFFPQPAPEPIPRGPTKRPRVKPPVETPDLFPIEIDPAWRVIRPYPVPVFRPDPVTLPRRGPLSRPRVRPHSVPLPHGWPSPTPVPAPTTRPSPAPTPRPAPWHLPKVLPYLLPYAFPLLFPSGPIVGPGFDVPPATPKPLRPTPEAPKPQPLPTSPLTPFQPGPLELGQPMPFRLGNDPCQCTDTKPKRKPRKQRTECRTGTYTETRRGTIKHPKRKVPCR